MLGGRAHLRLAHRAPPPGAGLRTRPGPVRGHDPLGCDQRLDPQARPWTTLRQATATRVHHYKLIFSETIRAECRSPPATPPGPQARTAHRSGQRPGARGARGVPRRRPRSPRAPAGTGGRGARPAGVTGHPDRGRCRRRALVGGVAPSSSDGRSTSLTDTLSSTTSRPVIRSSATMTLRRIVRARLVKATP